MKVLFLTNNEVSQSLIDWLRQREEVTVCGDRISVDDVRALRPDLIVSYSYRHILAADVLATMPCKFINLHISLLPYNRGADPNAWSFLDDTPKGVTIHIIDEGLDTGPTLLQREVAFDEKLNTLGSSYRILQEHIQDLFIKNWQSIRAGLIIPNPQSFPGTFHRSGEFAAIKERLMGGEGWNVPIPVFCERYRRLLLRP